MNAVFSIFRVLFFASLALFLSGGFLIVVTQLAGVFALDGDLVIWAGKNLSKVVYSFAAICAVSAFILHYQKDSTQEV